MNVGDIIRFNNGATALMRIVKHDDLCGYRTYYGDHMYGEYISVSGSKCIKASKEEEEVYNSSSVERHRHKANLFK